ncbi:potassium channel family protein [Streptomyces sp. NPDC005931]|uniref:potassium channel family protein n=1 Tax=Streptomyces sp. NPDC005931 TaxID=3364737 RepID=UPI0036B9CDC0
MAHRLALAGPAAGMAAMVTAYFLLPLDRLGPRRPVLSWILLGLALALVAGLLLRQVLCVLLGRRDTRPGLVIPLLMCLSVLVFASAYQALAQRPGELDGIRTRLDALYFTMVTLATIGYGDITPHGQAARLVTVLQILYTLVFLTAAATALSRHLSHAVRHHADPDRNRPNQHHRARDFRRVSGRDDVGAPVPGRCLRFPARQCRGVRGTGLAAPHAVPQHGPGPRRPPRASARGRAAATGRSRAERATRPPPAER